MPALPRVDRLKTLYSAAKGLNDGYVVYGVPEAPRAARFVPAPHRITLRFDPLTEGSSGVRQFISSSLSPLASSFPSVAFYSQPVRQQNAVLCAEYSHGRQIRILLEGESLEGVSRYCWHALSRSGKPIVKLTSRQSSVCPSIQGEWNPPAHDTVSESALPSATKYLLQRSQQ